MNLRDFHIGKSEPFFWWLGESRLQVVKTTPHHQVVCFMDNASLEYHVNKYFRRKLRVRRKQTLK